MRNAVTDNDLQRHREREWKTQRDDEHRLSLRKYSMITETEENRDKKREIETARDRNRDRRERNKYRMRVIKREKEIERGKYGDRKREIEAKGH